jgi:hypothetical protein
MLPVQPPGLDATMDLAVAEAGGMELSARDDPVLTRRDRGHPRIRTRS